jgi:iron complex outermembrane receptor protein
VSEKLIAYELGYRIQPMEMLMLSVSAFYNQYDDLRTFEQIDSTTYVLSNGLRGDTRGAEFAGTLNLSRWCRLRGGYNYLETGFWLKPGAEDNLSGANSRGEGSDPKHQFSLESSMDLPYNVQLNVTARFVDTLELTKVPSYGTFDVNLIYLFGNFEFSLAGHDLAVAHHPFESSVEYDLTESRHPEFGNEKNRQYIPSSITGRVTWRL